MNRKVGEPDGHGRWATIDVSNDEELVCCHECGEWLRTIGTHAWYRHGLTAPEYRRRHGLSTGQSLAAPATRMRMSQRPQIQPGSAGARALAVHRDPDRARAAMTTEGQHRPQRAAVRFRTGSTSRRGRELTGRELALLLAETTLDSWARRAQQLVDAGVRQAEIARATGIPAVTVSQRLRRRRAAAVSPSR